MAASCGLLTAIKVLHRHGPQHVTDVILLLIMLVSLLRLRRDGGCTFDLSHLLWKQVWWMFSLVLIILVYVCLPSGNDLDLTGHYRRGSARSTPA